MLSLTRYLNGDISNPSTAPMILDVDENMNLILELGQDYEQLRVMKKKSLLS